MFIISIVFVLNELTIIQGDFTGGYLLRVGSLFSIVEMNFIIHGIIMFTVAVISVLMIQKFDFNRVSNDLIWWGLVWILIGFIGGGWGGLCLIFGGAALILDRLL